MENARKLIEQASRYRRMLQSVDDRKTRELLETMARECERRVQEINDQEEKSRSLTTDREGGFL